MEDVNRIKLVLAEKKRTSKWLAEQLGVKTPHNLTLLVLLKFQTCSMLILENCL